MWVECIGLPGSGKTSVVLQTQACLLKAAPHLRVHLGVEPMPRTWVVKVWDRLALVGFWLQTGCWAEPRNRALHCRAHTLFKLKRLAKMAQSDAVYLLDQSELQAIWSFVLRANEPQQVNVRRLVHRAYSGCANLVVYFKLDAEQCSERLSQRLALGGNLTGFDDMTHAARVATFKSATVIFDDMAKALTERGVEVLDVHNAHSDDVQAIAQRLCGLILQRLDR
jgi:thymidylate kinase